MAIAKVEQEANQTNTNSQNATTTASPSIVSEAQIDVNQSNVSEQDGFAVSLASSDKVEVTSWGDISAGEDGIDAEVLSRGGCECRSGCKSDEHQQPKHQPKRMPS